MSTHDDEPAGISDERLPEDLRPTDDNPLAKPLTDEDDPRSAEELDVLGGKTPEESSESGGDGSDGPDEVASDDHGDDHGDDSAG